MEFNVAFTLSYYLTNYLEYQIHHILLIFLFLLCILRVYDSRLLLEAAVLLLAYLLIQNICEE